MCHYKSQRNQTVHANTDLLLWIDNITEEEFLQLFQDIKDTAPGKWLQGHYRIRMPCFSRTHRTCLIYEECNQLNLTLKILKGQFFDDEIEQGSCPSCWEQMMKMIRRRDCMLRLVYQIHWLRHSTQMITSTYMLRIMKIVYADTLTRRKFQVFCKVCDNMLNEAEWLKQHTNVLLDLVMNFVPYKRK